MNRVVLDASAVLAFVRGEHGGDKVEPHMTGGLMSAVNYSEVLKKSIEHGGSGEVTSELLERAQIEVIPFDAFQARQAAEMWDSVRELGLSFADRACLVVGLTRGFPILTADKRMSETRLPIEVKLIRERN